MGDGGADEPRRRPTVRVIVLGPDDRVLLFEVRDADGTGDTWWEAPGGGIEPGEHPAQAATRELAEEIGHHAIEAVPLDLVIERRTTRRGTGALKVEHVMAARLAHHAVTPEGWTEAEQREIVRWRWWTAEEVATSAETIFPAPLAVLLPFARARLDGMRRSARV